MLMDIATLGLGIGASVGASSIIGYAVKSVVPQNIGKIEKILVACGTIAIGSVVGRVAGEEMMSSVEEVEKLVNERLAKIKSKFKKS